MIKTLISMALIHSYKIKNEIDGKIYSKRYEKDCIEFQRQIRAITWRSLDSYDLFTWSFSSDNPVLRLTWIRAEFVTMSATSTTGSRRPSGPDVISQSTNQQPSSNNHQELQEPKDVQDVAQFVRSGSLFTIDILSATLFYIRLYFICEFILYTTLFYLPLLQVQTLLQQVQDRFQNMSDQILNRIDEMGTRIDDLEKNINDLMANAGIQQDSDPKLMQASTSNIPPDSTNLSK